jgi:hypothetical protein
VLLGIELGARPAAGDLIEVAFPEELLPWNVAEQ